MFKEASFSREEIAGFKSMIYVSIFLAEEKVR